MSFPDGAFYGVYFDKVLIHVGPTRAVLEEMLRVTRPGGGIGAIEWPPFMFIQANLSDDKIADTFLSDIELLSSRGEFSASFLVQAATGSKAAPNLERWRERSHVPVLVHD
jgi:ubiquinone/menaquinone biosynthesis C-methylase UbiE